jgi:hypothetical protein
MLRHRLQNVAVEFEAGPCQPLPRILTALANVSIIL